MEGHKLFFMGDYQLHEFHKVMKAKADLKFGNAEKNTVWCTDPDYTVKHLKNKYDSHILKSGVPDIIILGVGGKDLTLRQNINCVISSILRFTKILLNGGVKAIVILSLVQRNLPPPYNSYVKKINAVLATKAKHSEGLFFVSYTRKAILTDSDYTDGVLLIPRFYSCFYNLLVKMLFKNVLKYINSPEVLSKVQNKNYFGDNIMEHAEKIRELETEKEVTQLTKEIDDLISSHLNLVENKKKCKQNQK